MHRLTTAFENLLHALNNKSLEFYSDRLISFVVFGSVGRRVMRPDSDIDFLLVVDPLPRGRLRRVGEFEAVENEMKGYLEEARSAGVFASLSPVIKTPSEVHLGSPLFLDMVEDARILYDRDQFFSRELDLLRRRLEQLGAHRIWKGNAWYWDLKPDYRYGDEFEI
jgi:predicted nucleotidyltransferase